MPDSSGSACPLCGSNSWNTIVHAAEFELVECANKCIIKTTPEPCYQEEVFNIEDSEAVTIDVCTNPPVGFFRFAHEILLLAGRFQPSGRLLDIGSGKGHLLKIARDMGYDVMGIEPASSPNDYACRAFALNPLLGFFPDERLDSERFDVIILNHVLEHLPDPNFVLNAAARLLKDGGVLTVAAPDYNGLMRRLRGTSWEGMKPIGHAWQLTGKSIANLLLKQGLEIVARRNTTLQYNTSVGSLYRRLALKAAIGIAGPLNLGDNAIVVGRKPSPGK